MKIRPWLQGAGLAMLYLLPPLGELLSPARRNLYHQLMPVTTLTRGVLLDLLALGLLCGAGFVLLNRAAPRARQFLWLPVFPVAAWIAGRDLAAWMSDLARGYLLPWLHYLPVLVLLIAVCLLLLTPRIYQHVTNALAVVFASGGIALLFVVVPQLAWASFSRGPQEQTGFAHPVSTPWRPGEPRIVWILFDELSYDQAFPHRQPGVEMPAFDQLARESVSFSQLQPVGDRTDQVIPALLMGKPIATVEGDSHGKLLWRRSADAPWQSFDQNTTVFAAAKRQGWGTGVAGWFNPYCRILDKVLDRCYWTFSEPVAGELSSRRTTWQNALDGLPLAARVEKLWNPAQANQAHLDDYRSVMREGQAIIRDPKIRFALIHLPIPHPPGIFKQPGVTGEDAFNYLGNLLLTDQALQELRKSVAASPAAADTVLIVSSDHSWRTTMWRELSALSPAEIRATQGGVFDPRPVLMVRFPAAKADQIDRPESLMILHGLLLDLLSGKVRTPEDWIATLPADASAGETGQKK
jgi:sulfatase-like protein